MASVTIGAMSRHICSSTLGAILLVPVLLFAQDAALNTPNPELISQLTSRLGVTNDQAVGAAGAIFGLAKARLSPSDFTRLSETVPGMDKLLAAAPAMPLSLGTPAGTSGVGDPGAVGAVGGAGSIGRAPSGLSGLTGSFTKLGLTPDQMTQAASVVTGYVTRAGGPEIGSLLSTALK